MKNICLMMVLGIFLGGCGGSVARPASVTIESPRQELKGVVSVAGGKAFLLSGGKNVDIFSRKIDLKIYNGKSVTVIGEYSGTTLFVDEVKP